MKSLERKGSHLPRTAVARRVEGMNLKAAFATMTPAKMAEYNAFIAKYPEFALGKKRKLR